MNGDIMLKNFLWLAWSQGICHARRHWSNSQEFDFAEDFGRVQWSIFTVFLLTFSARANSAGIRKHRRIYYTVVYTPYFLSKYANLHALFETEASSFAIGSGDFPANRDVHDRVSGKSRVGVQRHVRDTESAHVIRCAAKVLSANSHTSWFGPK